MKKKSLLLTISIFFLLTAGLYILQPLFIPIPTLKQAIHQGKVNEDERLKMDSDKEAKLLETGVTPVLKVSEIVAFPNKYDKKLVRLRGCVFFGFETSVLMDKCELTKNTAKNSIWLDPLDFIMETEKVSGGRIRWRTPQSPTKSQVALLESLYRTENKLIPATIEGEFQSTDGSPYGHLGKFKYHLIVHRAIEAAIP